MNDLLPHIVQLGPLYMVAVAASFVLLRSGPAFMGRWNERLRDVSKAKAGDWSRLRGEIARLDERCRLIEGREEHCREELADALGRIAELEGYNLGQGRAAQDAQRMLSEERQIDAESRKARKPGLRRDTP